MKNIYFISRHRLGLELAGSEWARLEQVRAGMGGWDGYLVSPSLVTQPRIWLDPSAPAPVSPTQTEQEDTAV